MTPMTHDLYFPPAESAGGWRRLTDAGELRAVGVDAALLELARVEHDWLVGGESWSVVVIRNGHLVAEWGSFNIQPTSRFDVWSCTKSFTSIAWGVLLARVGIDLETRVVDLIPKLEPLTDERKRAITLRHLLTMTSGIAGESVGIVGVPPAADSGPFEHAFGRSPNRHGLSAATLAADPGTAWDYSDPAYAHLSPAFAAAAGRQLDEFAQEELFGPIGVEQASWDRHGGGGTIGPFTNAHTGLHLSARELARVGYLLLRRGTWAGREVVPAGWIDTATAPSQELNPSYGYGFWTNAKRTYAPQLRPDTFLAAGYRGQRCYVVPSLDLVVVRVATGPAAWPEPLLIHRVQAAVVGNEGQDGRS